MACNDQHHEEEHGEVLIRVTCHATGDIAYATSPGRAIFAAQTLGLDAGTRNGYRCFTFTNDLTDEQIAVVDGSTVFQAAKALR